MRNTTLWIASTAWMCGACGGNQSQIGVPPPPSQSPPAATTEQVPGDPLPHTPSAESSFRDDVAFLTKHGDVQILEAPHGARVAVSAKYQGRVMTSAVEASGASLGWIHRSFIEAGQTGTAFDNYGGEDRFWLGPEAGQFGLYFPPGKSFEFALWQTPAAFQQGTWDIVEQSPTKVQLRREITVTNHSGTAFEVRVDRTISLLTAPAAEKTFGMPLPTGAKWVGYQSDNRITNIGKSAWRPKTGLISIWILAMYPPSPDAVVAIPFNKQGAGAVVNDSYFGKVPAERLVVREQDGVLLFQCDGRYRSKIGLTPSRAKGMLGSYSASANLLTVVTYDPPIGKEHKYVNSMWEYQKEPYAGDVINSYNDGPTEPGKPPLGGFYELETSSPGAALEPGQHLSHVHRTVHVVASPDVLDPLARGSIGLPIEQWARGTK